ncbi:MAG: hypothetical protein AAGJ81_14780 [Verrucomicrobiota bacterium]
MNNLKLSLVLVLVVGLAGCETPKQQTFAPTPNELVQETVTDWVQGDSGPRPEAQYKDKEAFLNSIEVRELRELSVKYGYDPNTLVGATWEIVININHEGR